MTQAFEPRSRRAQRCATLLDRRNAISACRLQKIVHLFCSLRLAAATSKVIISVFYIFWPIRSCPANQLFLVCGDASGSICQLPRRQKAFFAEEVFCTWTMMPLWHFAIGVAGCAWRKRVFEIQTSHFNSRDLTKQQKTGAMSFFTSSLKTIKRSSSRRSRLSRQRTRAR